MARYLVRHRKKAVRAMSRTARLPGTEAVGVDQRRRTRERGRIRSPRSLRNGHVRDLISISHDKYGNVPCGWW
jgi:hypothetical protein